MSENEYPEILTKEQAAEYLQVTVRTIERLISKGELKSAKIGRMRRIRKLDLKEYLDNVSQK